MSATVATSELQRAYRELVASAALAVPSSGARVMILKEMAAIDAELARRGATNGLVRPQSRP